MKINSITPYVQNKTANNTTTPSFKGGVYDKLTDTLAKGIGKVVDTKGFSNLSHGLGKSKRYLPHLIAAESLWLSTFYVLGAMKNNKISKEQKKTEVYYQGLVTAFSAIGAYTLDSVVNKGINNFAKTFEKVNPAMDKTMMHNSLNGLKNLKSLVVFATIYRFIGPVLLNPIANKITGRKKGDKKPEQEKQKAENTTAIVNTSGVKAQTAANKGLKVTV